MKFKVGDLVLTTASDKMGVIVRIYKSKGFKKPYLVDFGPGFNGHDGGDYHTNTCWWCAEEEMRIVAKMKREYENG